MEERVLEILRNILEQEDIDESCSQTTCEKWDSMNHLNLVIELESEFGISLEPEEIGQMQSYNDIIRVLKTKVS